MAAPVFQITQAGLDKAQDAENEGLRVRIANFKLGTGFDYVPGIADTDLRGVEVFSGTPSPSTNSMAGGIEIVMVVPANVGPFQYGEIGLFLEDGTLFALAAFQNLQEKQTVATSGVSNRITFRGYLNLAQAPAVFIIGETGNIIPEVADTSFVTAPSLMLGNPNALIVNELILRGDNIFLTKISNVRWMLHNFITRATATATAVTPTFDTVTSTAFRNLTTAAPAGTYAFQDGQGNVRVIQSVTSSNSTTGTVVLSRPVAGLAVGANVSCYETINNR